jgi:hypothetical protein
MTHPILPRRLWHETEKGRAFSEQAALIGRREPLIILGEPGMGKTELLRWLGNQPGYAYCTARQLKNVRPDPRRLLGDAPTLVVDALDELSVQGEGDAVDLALQRLGEAGYPHFVLSCRVADWRNATGVSAIREQYGDVDLLVLHLEPLTDDEIHQILVAELGGDAAKADAVVAHFADANLEGLLGNPQTLELVARVAKAGPLPDTKSRLFERSVELLRNEHRDSKTALQSDKTTALDAAGAAFAALILTGSDALTVETAEPAEGEIPLGEVAALPRAHQVASVLGSRLFGTAGGANRFSYWHRRIGEYLGSRWLARQADTALKRRRLLALFQSHGVVPASLRGLHAWLAHHDPVLAPAVIAADPMGLIEYGDADGLAPDQARLLLAALQRLAQRNPRFRDWQQYSLKGVVQPQLLADVRALINKPTADFGLRLLLIEAVKSSPIAEALRPDLRRILLDPQAVFAHRSRAVDAFVALGVEDWQSVVETLRNAGGDDDVRLALKIVNEVGLASFSDAVIIGLVVTQAQREHRVPGLLTKPEHAVPDERLESLLDELVVRIAALGNRHDRAGNNELTDFGYQLIGLRLAAGPVDAARLWTWLRPFDAEIGYHRKSRGEVHKLIREDKRLRRAGQRLVLLDEPGSKTVWQRAWRLTRRSSGFTPTPDDIIVLLSALAPTDRDEKWRDLLELTRHSATEGGEVREAAKRLVANRPDMLAWIDKLAEPRVPDWQIKHQEKERQRAAQRAMEWQKHRQWFAKQIDAMRHGEFGVLVNPAKAYLGLFYDMNDEAEAQDRLIEWLGKELANAAMEGFEAFLQSDGPPTAQQIAVSHAESHDWNATPIIVAALAERVRNGTDFEGVSDDRLTAGFYELRRSRIDHQAKLETLKSAVEAEMQTRGLVETAVRAWIEPQLEHRQAHVDQLHALMRDDMGEVHAADFASDWLNRFPDMAVEPEAEMIDRLIESGRLDVLRPLAMLRLRQLLSEDRRRNWNAVAFLADFEAQHGRLAKVAAADPAWFWAVRRRVASDRGRTFSTPLSVDQLVWLTTTFRSAFPSVNHPSGVTTGNTNPWDASEFLGSIVSRLADMTSDDAIAALTALREAPADSYTPYFRVLAAEQQRKHTERRYRPPLLADVRALVEAQPPRTVADLQATLLELLDQVQKRIRADPADPWRGFYADSGKPRDEEWCRDHLLTMLGVRPESIDLMPEGHLADDNRADIIALLTGMRAPVEIKGQWHPELWRAADTQLDRLYATDYATERRGIYLVLWFGQNVVESKKPRAQGRGRKRAASPDELRLGLIAASQAAQDGRVAVVVIDLERPPRA